ncbi:MAG: RNA polymerase sigma factor [Armatimonadota bacterium]|nr:RNA polymerase sigma factor [Armatimonadota bacterium]
MREPRDDILLQRALGGDRDALGAPASRHRDGIYSFARRMLGDPDGALDAAQDTLLRAWTGLESFDPSRRFRPCLLAIAANVCTDALRRRGRANPRRSEATLASIPAPGPGPDEMPQAEGEVMRAPAHLSETERAVVLLKHVHGLTYPEIAEATGMPVGTLKSHAHRARRKLAEALEGREES